MVLAPHRRGALLVRAAMFDRLSRSMDKARKLMTGNDKLTSENMKEPLKEIRRALLEADVSLPVVRRFVKKVEEKALGMQVSGLSGNGRGLWSCNCNSIACSCNMRTVSNTEHGMVMYSRDIMFMSPSLASTHSWNAGGSTANGGVFVHLHPTCPPLSCRLLLV